jgi:hypothetical protein
MALSHHQCAHDEEKNPLKLLSQPIKVCFIPTRLNEPENPNDLKNQCVKFSGKKI